MYDTQIIIQIIKVTQIGFCESFKKMPASKSGCTRGHTQHMKLGYFL